MKLDRFVGANSRSKRFTLYHEHSICKICNISTRFIYPMFARDLSYLSPVTAVVEEDSPYKENFFLHESQKQLPVSKPTSFLYKDYRSRLVVGVQDGRLPPVRFHHESVI